MSKTVCFFNYGKGRRFYHMNIINIKITGVCEGLLHLWYPGVRPFSHVVTYLSEAALGDNAEVILVVTIGDNKSFIIAVC